ncbi:MAG: transglutaminase family protein [Gordonia sp. (in: high G+C Gram-positive bacteria)]|uniref:transglutaminase family protein n=1 Tax=Gordonia sp. (in: high G+C Gram-positive bacteria) TaxID=84139 RepID=UPI0039E23985
MTARLRVVHSTSFAYAATVTSSFNETRLTPRSDARQTVIVDHVDTSPAARQYRYTDYWGTVVNAFDLHTPHDRLEVTGTAVVETEDAAADAEDRSVAWDVLATDAVIDEYDEWLSGTQYTTPGGELADLARQAAEGLGPAAAVEAVIARVRQEMTYRPGTTEVHSTAVESWTKRSGVCQDFAHVTLSMIRSLGIPARYVSGYLFPREFPAVGETLDGESHAWIEVWTGGWWGIDPTNDQLITDHYVQIGTGRDYADVPPLKGVYTGGDGSTLEVEVLITRLA